ncbi:MAG: TonB-dependent receptor [Deltaproteobacteria bacterium]|jgi:iron complex outermembrane receptor protein|nr:TonB-dependent receptor [Deltaproteobacteria bacterium]
MKRWVVILVILIALMFPGINQAQDEKTNEPTVTTLDEVVVTATRQEEQISSVPANVTVVTETDINNSTAYDIPDLLRKQAGVHVNDIAGNRRNYTVDLRAFGETASLNTLVLVDGRRINQADLSGSDWALIPLDRIKKIEIIRGGRGSVLYGDNAAGGVINIITKEGEAFHAGAEINGGSYDTFKGSAYVSGTKNKLSYALSGSYLTSDGYRDNSDTEAKDLGLNLGFYQNDFLKWNLSGGFHKDSTGLPGAIKASEFAAGASRTDSLQPDDFADVEDYYVKGGPEIYFLSDSKFKMDVSFRKRNFLSFASFDAGSFEGDTDINTIAVSPQIIFKETLAGVDNRLIIGFDFTDVVEDITNSSIFFGTPSTGIFELKKKNYGYYIHDEIRPWKNFAISGGYRYDRAEFRFKPSTPDKKTMSEDLFTAGVNYNFYEKSSIYISFARSFRYPVLDELFNFFTNTIDTTLIPQTSDNYEIGIRHNFSPTLYADMNFFRMDTKNELFYNPTAFANENYDGKTRRDGVEISLTKAFEKITLSGNYTYTDATFTNGQFENNNVPNVPNHKAALSGLFTLGRGFSLTVDGVYVGERPFISDFTNNFEDQEDYLIVNAKLKYRWKQFTAFMNINNITDEEYSEYGGISTFPITEPGFFPSPKINFLAGISAGF